MIGPPFFFFFFFFRTLLVFSTPPSSTFSARLSPIANRPIAHLFSPFSTSTSTSTSTTTSQILSFSFFLSSSNPQFILQKDYKKHLLLLLHQGNPASSFRCSTERNTLSCTSSKQDSFFFFFFLEETLILLALPKGNLHSYIEETTRHLLRQGNPNSYIDIVRI